MSFGKVYWIWTYITKLSVSKLSDVPSLVEKGALVPIGNGL
jgi:hypothetical protein